MDQVQILTRYANCFVRFVCISKCHNETMKIITSKVLRFVKPYEQKVIYFSYVLVVKAKSTYSLQKRNYPFKNTTQLF